MFSINESTIGPPCNNSLVISQLCSVAILNIASSLLSCFGSGSVVFIVIERRIFRNVDIYPIFHLSIADLIASAMMFISSVVFLAPGKNSVLTCAFLDCLTITFYTITYYFTILYAVQVFLRLKNRRENNSVSESRRNICMIIAYAIFWIVPIILVLGYLIHMAILSDFPGSRLDINSDICLTCLPMFHFKDDHCVKKFAKSYTWFLLRRLGVLVPLSLVMVLNTLIYFLIIRQYRKNEAATGVVTDHQHHIYNKLKTRAILYQSVFIFCWLPSLVLGIATLFRHFQMKQFYWLYLIQAMTSPLQGFINSLVYAWKRKSFTNSVNANNDATRINHNSDLVTSTESTHLLFNSDLNSAKLTTKKTTNQWNI